MGLRNWVKSGFGIKDWISYDELKKNTIFITDIFRTFFRLVEKKEVKKDTFEECMRRYKITEADLQQRMRTSFWVALFCFILSILIFFYFIYLVHTRMVAASIVCGLLAILMLVYALREHFNYFQMKQRRLGCSIGEWIIGTIFGGK